MILKNVSTFDSMNTELFLNIDKIYVFLKWIFYDF